MTVIYASAKLPTSTGMSGALLINKHADVTSYGIINLLKHQLIHQQRYSPKHLPKLGHGGTLDPFATGLLIVLVGPSVKLARYFLGSTKSYQGVFKFGETTVPGDPTDPISEKCETVPTSLSDLKTLAQKVATQEYQQIPPMHSAKKRNGKPLYKLARQGLVVEREPKLCHLYEFEILGYDQPRAEFHLKCSSGTYVRTLAQDFGKWSGSLALLETLHRLASGKFSVKEAMTFQEISHAGQNGMMWDRLPCWIPYEKLVTICTSKDPI
jgi:tRNA pseudouridine55 synthase